MFARRLLPVYPASKDLRTWVIANAVELVLGQLDPLPDPVPAPRSARAAV